MPCYLFYHLFYNSAPLQFAPLFPVFLHLLFHPQYLLQLVLSLWIGLGQYSLLIPQSFLPRGSLSPLTRKKLWLLRFTRHDVWENIKITFDTIICDCFTFAKFSPQNLLVSASLAKSGSELPFSHFGPEEHTSPVWRAVSLEVAIGCTVNCRANAIIYSVHEFMAIII